MALWCSHHGALACTPLGETFQHKQGCRTTNSEDGFQAFQRPKLHYIWFGGRWGIKNYQETKRGAELILLLRTGGGGGHDIINFPFEAHFSVPLLIIIAYSLSLYLCCRSRMTDRNACLTTIFHPVPIILCSHNQRLRKKRHWETNRFLIFRFLLTGFYCILHRATWKGGGDLH